MAFKSPFTDPDGILVVDKPAGVTSHDVVHTIRKKYQFAKVGHGGTLDPGATGLLVILIGKGTKISDQVMGGDKVYTGSFRLGKTTSTQDKEGEILEELPTEGVTEEQLLAAMKDLTGDQYQIPPMVSAIKMNGVPLYKLARKGEEIERKQRFVHIYRYVADRVALPDVDFTVACTKGTYVRTLAHDVGQALGTGAYLTSLRREASGALTIKEAITLQDLLELTREALCKRIISVPDYLERKSQR